MTMLFVRSIIALPPALQYALDAIVQEYSLIEASVVSLFVSKDNHDVISCGVPAGFLALQKKSSFWHMQSANGQDYFDSDQIGG